MNTRSIGLAVFAIGSVTMVVGALLPWHLLPLYLEFGPTQEMVARVPELLLYLWIFFIPLGGVLAVVGGLIYGRKTGKSRK